MSKSEDLDVTLSDPKGAPPRYAFEWKPLDTRRMNWNHRRTPYHDAPSLIGRQANLLPVDEKLLKAKPNVDSI